MKILLLYSLTSAALYYLGSRALITRFIWSRYPPAVDRFALCSACTGFWYGLAIGYLSDLPFLGLGPRHWFTVLTVGLCMSVTTPLVAYLHAYALEALGTAEGAHLEGAQHHGEDQP